MAGVAGRVNVHGAADWGVRAQRTLCSGSGTVDMLAALDYCRDLFVPCVECNGLSSETSRGCAACGGSGEISAEAAESSSQCSQQLEEVNGAFAKSPRIFAGLVTAMYLVEAVLSRVRLLTGKLRRRPATNTEKSA
jgi:hypothetical protein